MLSHGFLKNRIPKKDIKIINQLCQEFISNKSFDENYFNLNSENIHKKIENLEKYFLNDTISLLNNSKPSLEAIELHMQKAGCEKIPPHQDNFYHCIESNMGIKILIPLQPLNSKNGGLIFIDCNLDFPIQKHVASSVQNFSSYIEESTFKNIKKSETSYNYLTGDISYHFLNSLHYSNGNKSDEDSLFLVFRYQNPNAKVNFISQSKYNKCVEEHKKLI